MRRRPVLAMLAAGAMALGAPAAAPASSLQADRSVERRVGQMVMGRMSGTRPSASLLRRVRAGRLGGVILFRDNVRSRGQVRAVTSALQRAARRGGRPKLLVAVDQEGGLVRRLPWAAPTMSAAAMGATANPARTAERQGRRTASALAADGINVDLAPVADVPTVARSFLSTRAFGRSPARVAAAACGFATGLTRSRRVAATLKHFPGLGAAPANTDFARVTITAPLEALRRGYRPYRRCAGRPRTLVMVASAAYRGLTGSTPAVLSRRIYRTELRRAGFRGVTISDDLQADALRGRANVAVRAARAGLDLLLFARTEGSSAAAHRRLVRAVRSGALPRARVRQSAARIGRLERRL
jgi:beta-N-acetylhexosaminidase